MVKLIILKEIKVFFVHIIFSIMWIFFYLLQPIDSLSQNIVMDKGNKALQVAPDFNEKINGRLLAELDPKSLKENNVVKKAKKKEVINKKIVKKEVVKKKTVKKKKKVSKNRMTKTQIRAEKNKKTNMLVGKASWYGNYFHGRQTASGALYDKYMYTSAHRTLPLGTIVEITGIENDARVVVCINDRGPYINGRAIDVSFEVAKHLDLLVKGIMPVTLRVVGDKKGKVISEDEAFYVSLSGQMDEEDFIGPFTQFADASVMWEAMHQVYDTSTIVIDKLKMN